MAKASEAQVPEPKPAKQADDLAEGRRAAGAGRAGKAHHRPVAAAHARTQAIERAAKEPGPLP